MARKFWERLGANNIQFYKDPQQLNRDEADERIADIQAILALDDDQKAILAGTNPTFDPFEALQDELEELADQRDYWDYDQTVENITIVEEGWFSPADGSLGPGTIVSVSSELVGAEGIGAIDKSGSTRWETDPNAAPHEIRFTWGYKKKIAGIRFRVGPSFDNAESLQGMSIWLSTEPGGLDNDNNRFLDNVDLVTVATLNDPWAEIIFAAQKGNARYCRIAITDTAAGNNRAVIRDIEMRAVVRTFGL